MKPIGWRVAALLARGLRGVRRGGEGGRCSCRRQGESFAARSRPRGGCARATLAGILCLLTAQQALAIEPFQEYRKRVESSQNISVLKDGLFGDSVNLYNGQTSFANVDIDIPGNNALPVQLARRFTVQLASDSAHDTSLGGAGGWDIDVPYIVGTFGPVSGWADSRCSSNWVPTVQSGFQLTEIWQGNSIHVPGAGDRTMLGVDSRAPAPADGVQYRITTSERDVFSCTPMKSGLGGEGFVMRTTSGVKYYFDIGIQRFSDRMTRSVGGSVLVAAARTRVYLLASKVEDRFGNTVEYGFNANGNPEWIRSSDGREIRLTYANGRLATASAAGRTWRYEYGSVEGEVRLSAVVLPDDSRWKFAYSNALFSPNGGWDGNSDPRCRVQPPEALASFTLGITHPSNAQGTFTFSNRRHYRSGVHVSECLRRFSPPGQVEVSQYWVLGTPYFFDVMSLDRKQISGPGLADLAWRYDYGVTAQELWGSIGEGARYPCSTCAAEKVVTVTHPDGVRARYRYGFLYGLNEGRVLGVDTLDQDGVVERSEQTEYLSEAEAAGQGFHPSFGFIRNGDDPSTTNIRPVVRRTIVQDAVTFTSKVDKGCQAQAAYCFDAFGRPTREVAYSPLGSKVDTTDFYDDTASWVLGQVKRTTTNGVERSRVEFEPVDDLPVRMHEFGRLKQVLTYNGDGTVATMSDGRDSATTDTTVVLGNWKRGTPQVIDYPATPEAPGGSQLTASVNDDGAIAWVIDENDSKTCYEYDAAGRLSGIIYPSDAPRTCSTTPRARTSLSFAPVSASEYGIGANHWKRTISTGNARQVTYMDALWRPIVDEKYDAADILETRSVSVKRYGPSGQVAFQAYPVASLGSYADPALRGTYSAYDALNRLTRVEQDSELGMRLTTSTRYLDGFRQEVTNPRGKITTTSYRAYDEPTTDLPLLVSHPEGTFTEIVRNSLDKPVVLRRRNGDGTVALDRRYVYHPVFQTLCKTIEPETGSTIVDFDASGNLAWSAAGLDLPDPGNCNLPEAIGSGRRTVRTYDSRNRMIALSFPDGRGNVAYAYEPNGAPRSLVTHNDGINANVVTTTYAYDRRGLLRRELMQFGELGWPIDYSYDANGNLATQAYHGLSIDYAPNALGQARKAGVFATGARYFPNGALREFTYGNGIVHTMTQNLRGLPERSVDQYGSLKILDDSYDYDGNANVVAITDGATGTGQRGNRTMTYDGLDRLTRAQSLMFGSTSQGAATYSYDVLDNLTRVTIGSTPTVPGRDWKYFYDNHRRLANVISAASGSTVIGLDYDEQGNMIQKSASGGDNLTFDFDYGNRLRKVSRLTSSTSQVMSTYLYDGLGRRIRDFNTGVTGGPAGSKYSQYSQAGQLLQASDHRIGAFSEYVYLGGSLVAIRERTGQPDAVVYQTKYHHTDSLGSPVAVTNAGRSILERREYEPYGHVLKAEAVSDGPGFTGHVLDPLTGLNYMQQRYYDSSLGKFLSADPVAPAVGKASGFNRFAYASGNPYKFTDPDGRCDKPTGTMICPRDKPGQSIGPIDVGPSDRPVNFSQKGGVMMSPEVHQKVSDTADRFQEKTGKKLLVTDGERTARDQASRIKVKIEGGVGLREYANRTAANEVMASYRDAIANGEDPVSAMAATIQAQVDRGVYISAHLRQGAADYRTLGFGPRERSALRESATEAGAKKVLFEAWPPHAHAEY